VLVFYLTVLFSWPSFPMTFSYLNNDFRSLLCILFAGEKKCSVASTKMNERSSRSHTIFRVTVESRKKPFKEKSDGGGSSSGSDIDEMGIGNVRDDADAGEADDDGAVRISTLNLWILPGRKVCGIREQLENDRKRVPKLHSVF